MRNQRNQPRHMLNVYLEVRDAETGDDVGRVVDLTTEGMRVVCNTELCVDREYHLLINADIGPEVREQLRLDAVCRWCGPDTNPDLIAAGLSFESLRPRQQTMLARVIRQFSFAGTC